MSLYHLGHSRTDEQLADMRRLEAAGICLFCPGHLSADPDQAILHRTERWTVTPNKFPYGGTRLHVLLIPDDHVTDLVDLPAETQRDFWSALAWVRDRHGLTHYGLGARNGDCECTGGSIRHLHVHVLVGDVDDPRHEPVRMKFSSRRVG